MRRSAIALLLLLGACHEKSFDERYRDTATAIEKENNALASDLATPPPGSGPLPSPT